MSHRSVTVTESTPLPYAQAITVGPHRLGADEPATLSGHDSGPTPYELLSAALGACTNLTLRMYAERKQWPLDDVTTLVTYEKQDDRDIFHRAITLTGNLTDDQRTRLLEIADRCPVSRTLEAGSLVRSALA